MKRAAAAVLFISFFCGPADADILRMRTGEEKRGKVLAEDERRILLDSETDHSVIEVPRSEISIWDRDDTGKPASGSYLGTFSSVPREKRTPKPPPTAEAAEKLIQDLIAKNPELESGFKALMDKKARDSAELDKLVAAAQQS